MVIILSREERERFAAWLKQDAQSTMGLVEQMEKLPNTAAIAKLKRTEALAQQIVANMLRSTEDMSI